MFSGRFKMIDKISIYRSRNGVDLEITHEPINRPNRLANRLHNANN